MDEGEVFDTNYDDQSVASSVSEGPPQGNWQNNDRTMEPLNLESRQPSATNLGNTEKSWRNITDSTDVSANISAITENPSPRSLHTSNSNETQLHFPTTTVPSAVISQGIMYSDRLDSPNNIENKSPPPSPLHPAHHPPVSPVKTSHKHSSHIRDTTTSPTSTTAKINYGPVWKPGFKNRRHESSDLLKTSFPAGFQLKTTKDKFFYQQVSPPRYQMDDSYVTSSQTQSQTQSNKFSFHDWTKGGNGVIGGDSEFDDSADEGDHFNHGDPYMDVAGPLLRDIQRARLSMEVSTRGSIETDPSCQIFKAPIFTQRPSSKKEPQRRSQTPLSAPKVFHAPASLPSLPVASALIRPYQTQKDYPPPWRPTSPKATTKTLASVQSSTTISTYDDWLQYKRSNLHQKVWKKKGNLTDFNYSAHSFNGCNDYDEMKYIPSPIHYIPTPLPLSIELEIYTLHQFNQFPLHELNTNTINSNNNTNRSIDTINSNTNNSNNSPQQQQKRGKAGSISSQIATPTMNASTSSLNTAIPPPHLVSSSSYSKLTRASLLETINNNNNNNSNTNTNTNTNTTNNNNSKTFEELQCNILTLIPSNMTFIDLQQHIIKDIIKQIHDLFIPSLPSLTTHIDKVNHQYHEEKNQSYLYENIDEKRLILMIYHYDYAIHQWKIINNEIEWVQVKHYHHHYYLQQQLYLQQQQQQYNHKNNEKDMKETLEIIQSQGLNMKLMYCIELLSEQYLLKQIQKNYEIRKQMIEKDRMNISLQQLTEVLDKEQIKKRKKYISSSSSSLLLPSQQAAFQPLPSYNNYDGEGRDAVSSGQFNNYDMDDQGLGSIVRPPKAKSLKKLVITKSMFLPTQSQSTYETSHQRRNSRTLAMSPMSQLNDSLTINSDHLNSVNGDTLLQTSQQIQHTKKLKSLQLSSSTSSPLLSSGASILYPKQSTVLKQLQEDAQKSIPKLQSFAEQLQSRLLKTKF